MISTMATWRSLDRHEHVAIGGIPSDLNDGDVAIKSVATIATKKNSGHSLPRETWSHHGQSPGGEMAEPNPLDDPRFDELSDDELRRVARAAVQKCTEQKSQLENLVAEATNPLDPMQSAGAIVGGGAAGHVMGTIQAKIDAGEKGYTEDNLTVIGVDIDVALASGAAAIAYAAHRVAVAQETQRPGSAATTRGVAKLFAGFANGAASGAAYRFAYMNAVQPAGPVVAVAEEEKEEPPAVEGGEVPA